VGFTETFGFSYITGRIFLFEGMNLFYISCSGGNSLIAGNVLGDESIRSVTSTSFSA
jgi:hypothetical protein